ncbi:MAG: 16S rRNA (adenine(1518)-N(6)/adenine(1519)-N(6))-dimethyltransferase RsmA [Nitrospinota bacterium]|nr:16S rRNA (adenine(1518)-N(6)/adenine(1519)-N(6))-dimethyltransferase RsmA [Nitrospinota bacterium]
MKEHGQRHKLGQHFLADTAIAQRIAEASGAAGGVTMVEIGPGKGALTGPLLDTGADVIALELDQDLFHYLKIAFATRESFHLLKANALKFEYNTLPSPFHVASNLPYSVAVPIIKKLIENKERVASMTLMTQAEVAHRLTASAGSKGYGSLSVFVGYHCHAEFLFDVPPSAFRPRPKVDSAVIRLVPRKSPPVQVADEEAFFKLVHTSFVHRRKTIKNNLAKLFDNPEALLKALDAAGVAPTLRAENITMEQFAGIYEEMGVGL